VALTDASDLVRSLRAVKSESEINKIRAACHIASDAFAALPGRMGCVVAANASLSTPWTERDAVRELTLEIFEQGGDDIPCTSPFCVVLRFAHRR
jgi:Xaa-Pro aminopeptidase